MTETLRLVRVVYHFERRCKSNRGFVALAFVSCKLQMANLKKNCKKKLSQQHLTEAFPAVVVSCHQIASYFGYSGKWHVTRKTKSSCASDLLVSLKLLQRPQCPFPLYVGVRHSMQMLSFPCRAAPQGTKGRADGVLLHQRKWKTPLVEIYQWTAHTHIMAGALLLN